MTNAESDEGFYLPSNFPYHVWKIAHTLHRYSIPLIPFLLQQFLRCVCSCSLPYKTQIGRSVHFAHLGLGVVVHPTCIIGSNVMIYQNVTLGASTVGNHVQIFAGAKIVNMVKIGNNVKIGANAVVIHDVPDNATAFGVPARIIIRR
jgi:serine O-acetyltransferase